MIIVDLNQIMYSTVLREPGLEVDEGAVRHIVLNILRSIRTKFKNDYGQIVIAADSYKYWRREFFPYYKANRKKSRDESKLDWTRIFECMNTIKAELKEFMPYKYIEVESAEADDIIATLVKTYQDERILIVSGDGDFKQLQKFKHVTQYDTVGKKFVKVDDPYQFLKEHILKGDAGDGIPNIVSNDNVFVLGQKQNRTTKKVQDDCVAIELRPDHPLYRNYIRNKTLIDLEMVPQKIQDQIIACYEASNPNRSKIMKYFMDKRLKSHLESLNEF